MTTIEWFSTTTSNICPPNIRMETQSFLRRQIKEFRQTEGAIFEWLLTDVVESYTEEDAVKMVKPLTVEETLHFLSCTISLV